MMKFICISRGFLLALVALSTTACATGPQASARPAPATHAYEIEFDARNPSEASVHLALSSAPSSVAPARDGNGAAVTEVRCEDGREATQNGGGWLLPIGCSRLEWKIAIQEVDATSADASLPNAIYSHEHEYLVLPERDGLLRAGAYGGTAVVRLKHLDGSVVERNYVFPTNDQPPFYAVVGARPAQEYANDRFALRIFGDAPDYPWMDEVHQHVLSTWAGWSRDLVSGPVPSMIDWAWVKTGEDVEPGYNASAGAEAIVSQIVLRDGDPDAEAKARVVIATSAAHEGFHTITGSAGQAWPAWVNESLANYFAIDAARNFLAPGDHRWLNAFYVDPEVRLPLLEAQALYGAGDIGQAQVFYTWGARFWRKIESVLTNQPNRSGKLAALIVATNNFADTDLNDADALAALLDRHSDDRALPIVRCFLEGLACPAVSME